MVCHAFVNSGANHMAANAKVVRPLGNRLRFAVDGDSVVCSPVVGLLLSGSPSAIFKAIFFGAIKPVKRHACWSWPHISDKVFKAVKPPGTHRNPQSTVVLKTDVFAVMAASNHHFPRFSFSGHIASAKRVRLFLSCLFALLVRKASARPCVSSFDFIEVGNFLAAAFARKKPKHSPVGGFVLLGYCRQSAKNLARKVSSFHGAFRRVSRCTHCISTTLRNQP
jgi:hypothetical protein